MPQSSDGQRLSSRYTAAFEIAFEVHASQVRKGTSVPYLTHVMSVSVLALEFGADEDCAIAALLHDAVEDADDGAAMLRRIHDQFGSRVATIVDTCSDTVAVPGQPKPPWRERKEAYIAHLASGDADALLVSACDKLHNARSIVRDLNEIGSAVWERFATKSGDDQVWYYQTLRDLFVTRIPRSLANALRDVVDELTILNERFANEAPIRGASFSRREPS